MKMWKTNIFARLSEDKLAESLSHFFTTADNSDLNPFPNFFFLNTTIEKEKNHWVQDYKK